MATPTYIALATTTLSSAASSVTFSSIPATYRDLVLVMDGQITDDDRFIVLQFNGDTGSNYSTIFVANTSSGTRSNVVATDIMYGLGRFTSITNIMDYSATDKHKTLTTRSGIPALVLMYAGRWANTNAINSLKISTTTTGFAPASSLAAGTTISLFGIEA